MAIVFKNLIMLFYIFILGEFKFIYKNIKNLKKKKIKSQSFTKLLQRNNALNYDYAINCNNFILVESLISHPGYFLKNIIIANHFRSLTGKEIILLINKEDVYAEKLAKSFKINNIIFLTEPNFFIKIQNIYKTFLIFLKTKNIKAFLKLKLKRINLGKLVYDNTLRVERVGTFKKLNYKIVNNTYKFLNSISFYNKLFINFKIDLLIQDEIQFYPTSTLFQLALTKNIKCYIKEGQRRYISLKKVDSINDCFENKSKYSKDLIGKISSSKSRLKVIKKGKQSMINRINGYAKENDINDAKHFKTGFKINKKKLCQKLNWDTKKPIGIIFANDLTDGVFTNSWSLFKDNLSWLIYHLNEIKKNKNINWLVKKHPSDKKNSIRKGTVYYFNKYINDLNNIKLLPDYINAKSLHSIVNYVFCSHGSAGLEFPFSKIPCVTTSDSLYNGLGFTYECKNINSLKKIISKPENLKTLNKKTHDLLCIFLDLYINRTKIKLGIPDFNPNYEDYEKFSSKVLKYLKKNTFYQKKFHKLVSYQLKNDLKHTISIEDLKF